MNNFAIYYSHKLLLNLHLRENFLKLVKQSREYFILNDSNTMQGILYSLIANLNDNALLKLTPNLFGRY